jgi:hypothetical protein
VCCKVKRQRPIDAPGGSGLQPLGVESLRSTAIADHSVYRAGLVNEALVYGLRPLVLQAEVRNVVQSSSVLHQRINKDRTA